MALSSVAQRMPTDKIKPSKLDCLFSAKETLLLHAGGRFIFIIHCHFLLISYSIFKNLELVCEGHVVFNKHDGPGNDCKLLQKRIQKLCWSTNHCKKSQLCTTSTYRPTRGKLQRNGCLQHPVSDWVGVGVAENDVI